MEKDLGMPSVEQVEQLITSLYEPNPPSIISETQAILSQLQNTKSAWALAHSLLQRSDEKVQFFGALTLIVKLNTESFALSNEEALQLLKSLIGWYLNSLHLSGGRLVTRKLVSALSTFFLKFFYIWPHFVHHISLCLLYHRACDLEEIHNGTRLDTIVQQLKSHDVQAALWVARHVVEDVLRLDLNSSANVGLYDAMVQNTTDVVTLMRACVISNALDSKALEDYMRCLQAWIAFSQRTSSRDYHVVELLRPLLTPVIESLANEAAFEIAIELVTEVLSSHPTLLTDSQNELIAGLLGSPWAHAIYQRLLDGEFDYEYVQFGLLSLSFADTRLETLLRTCDDWHHNALKPLCALLCAKGYPVAEDKIFVPAIEFWSNLAERLPDYIGDSEDRQDDWISSTMSVLLEATSNAWQKTVYPPAHEFSAWDSTDRMGFNDARKDVVDFLQSTYALVGPRLIATFVDAALLALSDSAWLKLEATAYCLGGLADCCQGDSRCDDFLDAIFRSSMLPILRVNVEAVPIRARQTLVTLVEQYTEYFERNPALLSPAIEFLFFMLAESSVSSTAARSIHRLCSSSRCQLKADISTLLNEYQRLIAERQLDCTSTEKVLGAIACITQAEVDLERRYALCASMLNLVESQFHGSLALLQSSGLGDSGIEFGRCPDTTSDEDPCLHVALKSLRCLASIGRGLRAPQDTLIDLEVLASTARSGTNSILHEVQRSVVNLVIEIQDMFSTSADVTEQICSVLRSGFSENEPGPFVLPPAEVANYLTSHTIRTPRIGLLVGTACSFLSSMRGTEAGGELLFNLLSWVIGLLKELADVDSQPELIQNSIEFVSRILYQRPLMIFQLQPPKDSEYFLLLSLRILDGREPLPKAAAAEFWTTFVNLRGDSTLQDLLSTAMETLGPLLCQCLARNIGGNASRSELDRLSEPLRKLISRHSKTKAWLEAAMQHDSFPSTQITSEQKNIFVKKLVGLRGSRATNQVIRDFWLSARGSNFAYAS